MGPRSPFMAVLKALPAYWALLRSVARVQYTENQLISVPLRTFKHQKLILLASMPILNSKLKVIYFMLS